MNEYNYDYYNQNSRLASLNDVMPNYIPKTNYMPTNQSNNNYNNQILEPYEGLIRGNLFANLYDPYKNYKIQKLNPKTESSALKNQWQQYNFALTDLSLYLDLHPNDQNALALYNQYNQILKQIEEKYNSMYPPLSQDSIYITKNNNWNWLTASWPWEGES